MSETTRSGATTELTAGGLTLAPGGIGHQPTEAEALEFMGAHAAAVFA